jgi:hypothetical protein
MKLVQVLFLFLAVALLTSIGVYLLAQRSAEFPDGTQSIPYTFSIGENPGVDVGTDVFRLGQVRPGGSSWRELSIGPSGGDALANEAERPEYAVVARGAGSTWLIIEPAIIKVPGNVNITLAAPETAEMGRYEGLLYVVPYAR